MKITFDNKLDAAVNFAKDRHGHQIRKDGKTLYWVHLARVAENLRNIGIQDEEMLCAGWLHDTIEDTATDYDDLEESFGQTVAELVASVTKDKTLPEKVREQKYVEQLYKGGWETCAIKLCDIWANIADVESGCLAIHPKRGLNKLERNLSTSMQ